ncbi:MAG: hypothetical protein ACI8S6_005673 [Myxococcota bacterium]|jgi:hypothetical protein
MGAGQQSDETRPGGRHLPLALQSASERGLQQHGQRKLQLYSSVYGCTHQTASSAYAYALSPALDHIQITVL